MKEYRTRVVEINKYIKITQIEKDIWNNKQRVIQFRKLLTLHMTSLLELPIPEEIYDFDTFSLKDIADKISKEINIL